MAGTAGGVGGTSGGAWAADRLALVGTIAITLVVAVVNSLTVADDFAGVGKPLDAWEPWVWELTSAVFWIAAVLPLVRVSRWLRPPRLPLAAGLLALLALSVAACAAHVGWLAVSRDAVYALLGVDFDYDWSRRQLVYEWRKDLLTVLALAGIGVLADRLTAVPVVIDTAVEPAATGPAAAPGFRLEVRDGARVSWLAPAEIERVEAAGNYVELHTAGGVVLHRATLAGVEGVLAPHGFVRIHRSRLVRRAAVREMVTTASGDFEATLASGVVVVGSRRFRVGME